MSTLIKVKLDEARRWLEEGKVKILLVVGFLIFMVLSLTRGIGYKTMADIDSIENAWEGHPCAGYLVTGSLKCTFNPLLYPITYIFGYDTNSKFAGRSQPHDYAGDSVKEYAEISLLLQEFPKNVPYYLAGSFLVAYVTNKLTKRIQTRFKK